MAGPWDDWYLNQALTLGDYRVAFNSAVDQSKQYTDTALTTGRPPGPWTVSGALTAKGTATFEQATTFLQNVTMTARLGVVGEADVFGPMAVNGDLYLNAKVGINTGAIRVYSDDAAAAAGGVTVGQVYRNSTFGNCLKVRDA